MIFYKEYKGHFYNDNDIYTFDIETTSFILLNKKIYNSLDYLKFNDKEKELCKPMATMYIWQFGINDIVYYGRTYEQLREFLYNIDNYTKKIKKVVFVHNLSYEMNFLRNIFQFKNVLARKSHKPMKFELIDINFEFRCSYFMTNLSLENIPKIYNFKIKKLVGNLDYTKIRHTETILSKQELQYCENDCLIVYEYIKKELETYKELEKTPLTATGHIRKEFKNYIKGNNNYKNKVQKSINTNPTIFNLLCKTFAGRIYARKLYIHAVKF